MLNKYRPIMSNALYAMIKKELMLLFRGWRSTVFLACMAVVFIGITMVACSVPDGDYASPIEYALGPGSLMLLIAIIGCQFAFAIDSIVGEYESNTIALIFLSPASRKDFLIAKMLSPILMWGLCLVSSTYVAWALSNAIGDVYMMYWGVKVLTMTILFFILLPIYMMVSVKSKSITTAVGVSVGISLAFVFLSPYIYPLEGLMMAYYLTPVGLEYYLSVSIMIGGTPLLLGLSIIGLVLYLILTYYLCLRVVRNMGVRE